MEQLNTQIGFKPFRSRSMHMSHFDIFLPGSSPSNCGAP
jgi:hypothetical protein